MMQMKNAKLGKITEEMDKIIRKENVDREKLIKNIADGKAVILKNDIHNIEPVGIGKDLRVKINVNIGTSLDHNILEEEIQKYKIVENIADTIMDLSTGFGLQKIRNELLKISKIPIGTVPIYETAVKMLEEKRPIVDMSEDEIFDTIENQLKQGIDFITVHVGITRELVERMKNQRRVVGIVSRGGTFLASWMLHNKSENPLFKNFDYLLDISEKYDAVLSLGDALRPGGIPDASDQYQIGELVNIAHLVKRARERNIQTMVEGPGHLPISQIESNMKIEKLITDEAPFYVLGPLITDIASGYDHINAAIGGAVAAYYGANFLCYVTPAEHLALPTPQEVYLGAMAMKIAAHAINLLKFEDEYKKDMEMSIARGKMDWTTQMNLSIDKENAIKIRKSRYPKEEKVCTMCGELCAIKLLNEYLNEDKPLSNIL
ncbi:MAG: phosphomethylpyrimidine synthase ThiC [Thermoplasmata archaeon]